MRNEFTYVVEPPTEEDRWFIAYCPELPEANGQGETEEEAIVSLRGAIELILAYRREQGLRGVPTTAHLGTVTIG